MKIFRSEARRRSSVVGGILLLVFGVIFVLGRTYPSDASLFPLIVGSAGFTLTAALLATALGRPEGMADSEDEARPERFWLALSAAPLFSVAVGTLGFYPATFLETTALPLAMGFARWRLLLAMAVGTLIVLHLMFGVGMGILLPPGMLGDFLLRRFVYDA